ncbi:MAG: glycosyltransferase family 4 protein [Geminicoccaceae bacterium]
MVPGPLDQRTGGYIYDRRIVEGLRASGWSVQVHELAGSFPDADDEAIDAAGTAVRAMDDGVPIIDGLALPAFRDLTPHLPRPWIGLIHHPLAMETGLSTAEVAAFAELESRLMRAAGHLIVTSPKTRRDLQAFDVDPETVSVVCPGVDAAPLARGSHDRRDRRPTALLCIGSLTKRKGHLVLLSALAHLPELDWRLTIVGSALWDPDHAAKVEQAVRDHGFSERVTMVGEQDEDGLARFYQQADLFVLASHHEGYGMVLAEALARGLPILSTTAGAIPDTVPEGAGFLVPPGDAVALAAALRDVLTDKDTFDGLKEGAARARNSLASWRQSSMAFDAVLQSVVGR